jgi:hypothetical protein
VWPTRCALSLWLQAHLLLTQGLLKGGMARASSLLSQSRRYSALSNGDIVHIHGLKSEQGKKMNGLAAEVISKDKTTGRFNVLFTAQEFIIKAAALKPENLKLQLAVASVKRHRFRQRNGLGVAARRRRSKSKSSIGNAARTWNALFRPCRERRLCAVSRTATL